MLLVTNYRHTQNLYLLPFTLLSFILFFPPSITISPVLTAASISGAELQVACCGPPTMPPTFLYIASTSFLSYLHLLTSYPSFWFFFFYLSSIFYISSPVLTAASISGAELQVACCGPPISACVPPASPCVASVTWPQRWVRYLATVTSRGWVRRPMMRPTLPPSSHLLFSEFLMYQALRVTFYVKITGTEDTTKEFHRAYSRGSLCGESK